MKVVVDTSIFVSLALKRESWSIGRRVSMHARLVTSKRSVYHPRHGRRSSRKSLGSREGPGKYDARPFHIGSPVTGTVGRLRQSVGHQVRRWATSAGQTLDEAINEDRIRLAVTGLSRAGKTVFITSLIQNLLALGAGRDTLPLLTQQISDGGVSRLERVELLPVGALTVPYFDPAAKLAGLAGALPVWPQRTDDIAQVSLALTLRRKSAAGRRVAGNRRVRLDILDYPGEWLLDLPLLRQSFAEWSAQTLDLMRQPPRDVVAAEFLRFLGMIRQADRADEDVARRGYQLYRNVLAACRTRLGLRYLQPGRFLCPGPRGDGLPFMWFFPMSIPAEASPAPGTIAALLEERFEAYKRDMRSNVFDQHFGTFDRQVMLVDVLGALYTGETAFDDTARAIREIAAALRYSDTPGVWRKAIDFMWTSTRSQAATRGIERVAIVATKSDHVPALRRDNLRTLVHSLAEPVKDRQTAAGAVVSHHAAASLRATEDGTAKLDGQAVQVVRGIPLGEEKVRSFYVGEVPVRRPPADFWRENFLEIPEFKPPPIALDGAEGVRHIGLDAILVDLIGDLL